MWNGVVGFVLVLRAAETDLRDSFRLSWLGEAAQRIDLFWSLSQMDDGGRLACLLQK